MKEYAYSLPPEQVTGLEALDYEVRARQSVVAEMLAADMDIDTAAGQKYQKELTRYMLQYETANAEFARDVVEKLAPGGTRWNLDFSQRVLTVYFEDHGEA